MQPEDSMQLPIICLTTKDGTVYGVGHTPSYPKHISNNPIYQEILKNEKSDSDCHIVNGIHEQPDGAMIEIAYTSINYVGSCSLQCIYLHM